MKGSKPSSSWPWMYDLDLYTAFFHFFVSILCSSSLSILQTLNVARGLTLNDLNTSSKLGELEAKYEHARKRAVELKKEWDMAVADLRKAWDEIGVAKDEAEDAKLELLRAKKSIEDDLVKARAQGVEDFIGWVQDSPWSIRVGLVPLWSAACSLISS